jgi:uncharacterized protein YpuA (DUF1002 family)
MSVETVVEEVKNEVFAEATLEPAKVVAEVVKTDDRVKQEVTDGEKFAMAQMENDFLKAQIEMQQISKRMEHLQEVTKKIQANFVAKTAEMAEAYSIDLEKFIYNSVEHAFTKK